ncbi:hypothetical protein CDAR_260411 [Caerostris darwini]|uniref:Uncharacterized protein n=1 Tax=Caerostris darwini TaxID=1538125 RepID=A0AAV4NP91_9ARAC|nr:hypothetical protein CDAR_260411 [Caerostris darwini]
MATDFDGNLFSKWPAEDQTNFDFKFPEHQHALPIVVWILLAIGVLAFICAWAYCIVMGLKERGFKNSYSSNLLSQLPTSTPFVNQNDGERYYPRHNYVQLSRSFDFVEFGNLDAPPKYSDVPQQEPTAVDPSGRFNCPTIIEEGRLESPPPAYKCDAPFEQGVGFVNYI